MVHKSTLAITTTVDQDVFALIVYTYDDDDNPEFPIKLYQLVKDEWVLRNEYKSDVHSESPACWFHDPGSEKHEKLIGCFTKWTELRFGVTEDSKWETHPYTDEVQRATGGGSYWPYVTYTTPCTTANHNSDFVLEYIDWQWAFCFPWLAGKQNLYELHRKSNDSDWEIKLIEETMEPGKLASCINAEGIDVYYIEWETSQAWVFHKPYDGEEYTKNTFGQPGDFVGVYCLCAVSRWFAEPRLFGISDGYVKEFQWNESRTHIVGTPITKTRNINISLRATIQQDRHDSPETIRLVYFPDEQDIMGTYVWTKAEGWKPGPQIV